MRVLLSASAKADTHALCRDLIELGAEVVPTTEIGSGGRLARAVQTGDRLVALLQDSPAGNAAILVEIGIAIGMGLPVLIVATSESTLPAILGDVFILRSAPGNSTELLLGLKLFLRAESTEPPRRAITITPPPHPDINRFRERLAELTGSPKKGVESEVERLAADLFRQFGAQVEEQRLLPKGGRPDIAFSVPGQEGQLGTVLIELKFSHSPDALEGAARQLQRYLSDQGRGLGLILYIGPEQPVRSWPMIIAWSIERLLDELTDSTLADVLIRARNEAIHNL